MCLCPRRVGKRSKGTDGCDIMISQGHVRFSRKFARLHVWNSSFESRWTSNELQIVLTLDYIRLHAETNVNSRDHIQPSLYVNGLERHDRQRETSQQYWRKYFRHLPQKEGGKKSIPQPVAIPLCDPGLCAQTKFRKVRNKTSTSRN